VQKLQQGVYNASISMIEKLAKVLNVELAALLERVSKARHH
jgi:hypothetical protein